MDRMVKALVLIGLVVVLNLEGFSQPYWTAADYQKALWMTTRFYGGQRSGENNWLLYNHLPSGVNPVLRGLAHRADYNTADNVDLSGGWNDCGDHVKFGQTQFYSAYILIKGYAEFPTGYGDKYDLTYSGYKSSGQWNWEGSGHHPNCIPDVLDEMKHETDFLIKCTPNGSTFWYQVGNGGCPGDHCRRETAVKTQTYDVNLGGNNDNGTPGTRRPSCKNPNDGMMASLAGAALAVMARVYAPYDAAYANLCLTHALNARTYASTRLSNTAGSCFGGFYGAPATVNATNAYVCLLSELYITTGNATYRTQADSYEPTVAFNAGWAFDYANIGEIALYCLAQNGNTSALNRFNNRITGHYMAAGSRNAAGVYTAHGTWGRLRYNANAAFLICLYSKLNNNTSAAVINAIHNDIDYIMGKNSNKRSYIVGFEPAAGGPFLRPLYPHHRNVYLDDTNQPNSVNIPIPAKNTQMGALVGGQRDGTYNDMWDDYVNSEVCIDYNAGLVGALGFIVSRLAPVTGGCAACRTPNLGPNLSTCSGTSLPVTFTDLNNPGPVPSGVTYTWYHTSVAPGNIISGPGTNKTCTNCGTAANTLYIVKRDSTGGCSRTDTIVITNSIPAPNLGSPKHICSPAFYNLSPSNLSSFPSGTTWQWAVDYSGGTSFSNLAGETNSTLSNVRRAGNYRLTATAGSCTNNSTVIVTSSLPTPVDGCAASGPASVPLSITNPGLNGTNYNWYTAPTGGSIIPGGTATTSVTSPSITVTTTYYVQDMSSSAGSVGPTTFLGGGSNWGVNTGNRLLFTATSNFTLHSLKIPFDIYSTNSGAITIEIWDNSNTVRATATSQSITPPSTGSNMMLTFTFSPGLLINPTAWGSNLKMVLTNKGSLNGDPKWNNNVSPAYNYCYPSCASPIVSITGYEGGDGGGNDYMYFYDWQISTGTPCDRLPVVARIGGCSPAPVTLSYFNALLTGKDVLLTWITTTETNNNHFLIQRSINGKDFYTIGKVNGSGTTYTHQQYSFADYDVPHTTIYYRLAQVDYDGSVQYSPVVKVDNNKISKIEVSPNPFHNETTIYISGDEFEKPIVRIMELSGKIISEEATLINTTVKAGGDLPAGTYIVQVVFSHSIQSVVIVKQ